MDIQALSIPGCYLIKPRCFNDERGRFVKALHASTFASAGLRFDFREQYYSVSGNNVIRGLHFQNPPHAHDKLVMCLEGKALDVIVDLRKGSPQYGRAISIALNGEEPAGVYIVSGCAHGFLSMQEGTMLLYNVTSEFSPELDSGIRWNSIDFDWPQKSPTISARDAALTVFEEFESPFVFEV